MTYFMFTAGHFMTEEEKQVVEALTINGHHYTTNPDEAEVFIFGDSLANIKEIYILGKEKKNVEQYINARNFLGRFFFT